MNEVEIALIDRRFEKLRLKNRADEKRLLSSIAEQGIREALSCIMTDAGSIILLDGFKRLRCCVKLNKYTVPVVSMGNDEAGALIHFIRLTNAQSLNIFEQAALVDHLRDRHGMTIAAIADAIERSPAWVSIRLGIIAEISQKVRDEIFTGRFPARSYLYTLKSITRVNKVGKKEIDEFVMATSGKGLSTRSIERLAYGYFRGGANLREQIREGRLEWTLKQMKHAGCGSTDPEMNERERYIVRALELVQKYMNHVLCELQDSGLKSNAFKATVHIVVEGIMEKIPPFTAGIRRWRDDSR